MAQDYAQLIQAMMQSPEVMELMKRTKQRSAEAEAQGKGEAQRRGLVSGTGTSDIEMAFRRSKVAPIEEAGQGAIAGLVGRGVEAERGRQYGTSEREASQLYGTGEREASQRYGTGEREASQLYGTGERIGSQEYGAGQNELQRKWQSGESVLDRQANVDQWNREQSQNKRNWWKGFLH